MMINHFSSIASPQELFLLSSCFASSFPFYLSYALAFFVSV